MQIRIRTKIFFISDFKKIVLATGAIFGFVCLVGIYTHTIKTELNQKIDSALNEVIQDDYTIKLSRLPIRQGAKKGKTVDYTLMTDKGPLCYTFEDSVELALADQWANQYMFSKDKSLRIDPRLLQTMLTQTLNQYGLDIECGVIYRDAEQDTIEYSTSGAVNLNNVTYHTDPIYIDIERVISVQAWSDYSIWFVLRFIPSSLWIIIALGIGISSYCAYKYLRKTYSIPANGIYIKQNTVHINGQASHLTKQSLQLLQLFLSTPDKFITKEAIKEQFWAKHDNADSNIYNQISTLKQTLKKHNYDIVNTQKKGYQLTQQQSTDNEMNR